MSEQTIAAIISGIVGISVAIISKTNFLDRTRSRLLGDIELHNLLPDNSKSKVNLLDKIDREISMYVSGKRELRRDATGIVLGLLFLAAGTYLTWFFLHRGSWWLLGLTLSIFMVILGLVGFFQDVARRERDEKGRPIKEEKV